MRGVALVAAVVVVVAAGAARAQPADDDRRGGFIGEAHHVLEIDDCPPQPPDKTPQQLDQLGGEHFSRGEVLYVQGDYQGAVTELVKAYCIHPYYTILKDIGQAYERELEYEKAIAYLSRFVWAVPKDAKRASSCDPDPQDEKTNVLARIKVLSNLKAKIRVETLPPDADVTLTNDAGVAGRAKSGREIEVKGGTYTITIERAGFRTVTRENVPVEIGKPYTLFEPLEPVKGHLRVRVVPAETKLYLDQKPVGTGAFEAELANGHYTLLAEAPDRKPTTRDIEVLPDKDTIVSFELEPIPQLGRRQLLAYGTIAAGVAAGALAGAQSNPIYDALAVGGGLAAGFAGVWFGTREDLSLGTSSLTITSSLIGGAAGGGLAALVTGNSNTAAPIVGVGLILGAGAGYYAGDNWKVTPGDAAVINSGALWGGVVGGLLAISFTSADKTFTSTDRRVAGAVTLSGLGMGTIGGVLLQRYATISRGHAALIDASGVVGVVAGLASLSVYNRVLATTTTSDERTSNFALGGLAVGLVIGGVLTRHMDEPLGVAPAVGKVASAGGRDTTTYGLGWAF